MEISRTAKRGVEAMKAMQKPLTHPPQLLEAITYLERIARGEVSGKDARTKQFEEMYLSVSEVAENLSQLVKNWGDRPALRQILFLHYLHREPLMKEILSNCIYPRLLEKRYYWKEGDIRFYLQHLGMPESEQVKSVKVVEKALSEAKILSIDGSARFIEYQRPAVETIAYALYVEYGDGFEEGRRFALKNPPLQQILEHAAFPAYLLLDPRSVHLMLEACRMKNYISLEARGGLCQYALIYQDLTGLIEYMVQGGHA